MTESREGAEPNFGWKAVWDALSALPDRRHEALAVLNGAYGDTLEREESQLAIPTSFYSAEGPLDLGGSLEEQLPDASSRIVILVHGLMCTETIWSYPKGRNRGYGVRLGRDVDVTPIYVRYNSGRGIAESGRDLASAIEELVDAWPVPVSEVNLIGHSMGALVCRSAAHYAALDDEAWVALVRRIFLLAVPRRGQPIEQFTGVASVSPAPIPSPWTRIIGWCLRQNSAGVRDLMRGAILDDDDDGEATDRSGLDAPPTEVPLLPGVEHFVVAASMSHNLQHPVTRIFADAFAAPWAPKDGRVAAFMQSMAGENARVFTGMSHLALVNHPEVYQQILDWWRATAEEREDIGR